MAAGDWLPYILGTIRNTFKIGKAILDASGLTVARTISLPDAPGFVAVQSGTAVGNTDYTILSTDRYVYTTTALTAVRAWTLPLANSVPAGTSILAADLAFAINTGVNGITVSKTGSDTLNLTNSITIEVAGGMCLFVSNGVSKWYGRLLQPILTPAGDISSSDGDGVISFTIRDSKVTMAMLTGSPKFVTAAFIHANCGGL